MPFLKLLWHWGHWAWNLFINPLASSLNRFALMWPYWSYVHPRPHPSSFFMDITCTPWVKFCNERGRRQCSVLSRYSGQPKWNFWRQKLSTSDKWVKYLYWLVISEIIMLIWEDRSQAAWRKREQPGPICRSRPFLTVILPVHMGKFEWDLLMYAKKHAQRRL